MSQFHEGTLLASGARTTTQTLDPASIAGASAVYQGVLEGECEVLEVFCNLTAFSTTASLTMSVEFYDTNSAAWVSVLAATALTATGTKRLLIGPRLVTAANAVLASLVWPRWRVVMTHGNANSHTYSVSARVVTGR